jgi:two-component system chemotaxis response regulator CheY
VKILIVDDSKAMRTLLRHFLHELQFESAQAEDGVQALEMLHEQGGFDLALVDWDMPRMNGLELVQAVRANARFNELKLMMVTAQNSMERVCAALEAGATDFLMKPVTRESLEDKLRVLGVVQ